MGLLKIAVGLVVKGLLFIKTTVVAVELLFI